MSKGLLGVKYDSFDHFYDIIHVLQNSGIVKHAGMACVKTKASWGIRLEGVAGS